MTPNEIGQYRESIKSVGGTNEIVRNYIETTGGTIIPSTRNVGATDKDFSGLQINGFNPHVKYPEVIDPDMNADLPSLEDVIKAVAPKPAPKVASAHNKPKDKNAKAGAKKEVNFVDPSDQVPAPVPVAQKRSIPNPTVVVYLHGLGVRLPYRFHEVYVKLDDQVLALTLDTRAEVETPVFDKTEDGQYLVFSFGDPLMRYFCTYHGQSVPIAGSLMVHLFVIAKSEPYPS